MPLKSVSISRLQVKEFIYTAFQAEGVIPGVEEETIIESILDTLFRRYNPGQMVKWCRRYVVPILENIKDERLERIRHRTRLEFLYFLYRDSFNSLSQILENKKSAKINPQLIRRCDENFSLILRRYFKTMDGQVAWEFISTKLGVGDKWVYQEKIFRSEEQAVAQLLSLLTRDSPKVFNPDWILSRDSSLYRHIKTNYKNAQGLPDWSRIVDQLPGDWPKCWSYKAVNYDRNFQSCIRDIVKLLEARQPKVINPSWIFCHAGAEYNFFQTRCRTVDDHINWEVIKLLLPPKWASRWRYQPRRTWDLARAISSLRSLLEFYQPETFNAHWIKIVDYGLYLHVVRSYRKTSNKVDWHRVVTQLSKKWRQRWRIRLRDEERRHLSRRRIKWTFKTAVAELRRILEQDNPQQITSSYIGSRDPSLLSYFVRHVRADDGSINWELILDRAGAEYKERFVHPEQSQKKIPKVFYRDEQEVKVLLESSANKTYTLFELVAPDDMEHRNRLYLMLVKLAQKGNLAALEYVVACLEIIAAEWVEQVEGFEVYRYHMDVLKKRIRKCVFYHRYLDKSFIGYLFKSLKLQAKGLWRAQGPSLNTAKDRDSNPLSERMADEV